MTLVNQPTDLRRLDAVRDGVVTLSGRADWAFQRRAADRAARESAAFAGS